MFPADLVFPLVFMTTPIGVERPDTIRFISERWVEGLEDKHLDLCYASYQKTLLSYRRKRFWPLLMMVASVWLVLPAVFWRRWRRRLPEWQTLNEMRMEIREMRKQRRRRTFWNRIRRQRNRIESEHPEDLRRFYRTLASAARNFNTRVRLLDFTLDRQAKQLDPPFTVQEFEQIEATFRRIRDELSSAFQLLALAEQDAEIDLVRLMRDEYGGLPLNIDYLDQSANLGQAGQLVHDLLCFETTLRDDLAQLAPVSP